MKPLLLTIAICLVSLSHFCAYNSSGDSEEFVVTDFVQVQNADFILKGEPFHFAGSNAYYLPNYQKIDPNVVDRTMDLFELAGVRVVRMWGFYDGFDCGYSATDPEENVIQTEPDVYNESALRDLDQVIAKGKQRGIMFIIPFINYWDELGGICQYNTWANESEASINMTAFIENEQTQRWYKNYIAMLLNRINTVTGVAYKDEPAIFSWQIINEGRNKGQDPKILRDWYREMAQYIKAIDSNHLVGTGEEGFDEETPSKYSRKDYSNTYVLRAEEGTSYIMNTSIPEIDYGNAHFYAPDFGFGHNVTPELLLAQKVWIQDHQKIAEELGKPFLLGEYGFPGWADERVQTIYQDLWKFASETKLDGSLIWQLTPDYTKCYEFGGNICWPEGRKDTTLYLNFKSHIQQMNSLR
jgi:mannan endo-1,4-beta-mannosidase